jgi:hypothetical protein
MLMRRLVWLPLAVLLLLAWSVPLDAYADRGGKRAPRTALQKRMAEHAKLALNPGRRPGSELPNGPIRARLTRFGGSSENFTVSDRKFLFRGRVREASDGSISVRVTETYEKKGKRGRKLVPTENPWE